MAIVEKVKKDTAIYDIQDSRISDINSFVTLTGVQTLNNKTLVNPVIQSGTGTSEKITVEGKIHSEDPIKLESEIHGFKPISIQYSEQGTETGADSRAKWTLYPTSSNSGAVPSKLSLMVSNDGASPVIEIGREGTSEVDKLIIDTGSAIHSTGTPKIEKYVDSSKVYEWSFPAASGTLLVGSDIKNTNIVNGIGGYSLSQVYSESGSAKGGTAIGYSSSTFGYGKKGTYNFIANGDVLTISGDHVLAEWLDEVIKYKNSSNEILYRRIKQVNEGSNYIVLDSDLGIATGTAITVDIITHAAIGGASFIEGSHNQAFGDSSHAEGSHTAAVGFNSHTGGYYTIAGENNQTAIGKYNNNKSDTLFEVGNGSATSRSNAFEVHLDGRASVFGAPSGSADVVNLSYFKENVAHNGAQPAIIVNATTNVNGHSESGYTSQNTTVSNYPVTRIKYNGSQTISESEAKGYMKYMTGSDFLPTFSTTAPSYPIFVDGQGRFYKPEYKNQHLDLYHVKNPFAKKLWKHTLKQTGSSAYYAIVLITNSPEPIPNYVSHSGYITGGLFPYLESPHNNGVVASYFGHLHNGDVRTSQPILGATFYNLDTNVALYYVAYLSIGQSSSSISMVNIRDWVFAADEVTPYDINGEY